MAWRDGIGGDLNMIYNCCPGRTVIDDPDLLTKEAAQKLITENPDKVKNRRHVVALSEARSALSQLRSLALVDASEDGLGGKDHIAKVRAAISYGKTCAALDWVLEQLKLHDQPPARFILSKLSTKRVILPAAIMDHLQKLNNQEKDKGQDKDKQLP